MTVMIDYRAGSKELVRFKPLDTIGEICTLDSADAAFAGNGPDGPVLVGVEVKSLPEMISSADRGRLQAKQIPDMLAEYDVSWLLYYGIYRPSVREGRLQIRRGKSWRSFKLGERWVPYGYVESLLLTLTAAGMRIKRVDTMKEAAMWIGVLYRWWSKEWHQHKGMKTFDRSRAVSLMPGMSEDVCLRAKVAAQLPGVGYTRAVAVAKHFGSIQQMINAGPDEWAKVDGIGKVIAKTVGEAVR